MHLIKTCCCGYSLRTGTMVIGYIQLAAFAVTLITLIAVSPSYSKYEIKKSYAESLINPRYYTVKKYWPLDDAMLLSCFFVGFLMTISILLIVGASKGNMWFMLPWLSNTGAGVLFSVISWIYGLVKVGGGPYASLMTFSFFSTSTTSLLCLLVVVSHFEELRKELMEGETRGERRDTVNKPKNMEARVTALESMVGSLGRVV